MAILGWLIWICTIPFAVYCLMKALILESFDTIHRYIYFFTGLSFLASLLLTSYFGYSKFHLLWLFFAVPAAGAITSIPFMLITGVLRKPDKEQ